MKRLIERHVDHTSGAVSETFRYTEGPFHGQIVQYVDGIHKHGPVWPEAAREPKPANVAKKK